MRARQARRRRVRFDARAAGKFLTRVKKPLGFDPSSKDECLFQLGYRCMNRGSSRGVRSEERRRHRHVTSAVSSESDSNRQYLDCV